MSRVVTILTSLGIVVGLVGCCCRIPFARVRAPAPPIVFNPPAPPIQVQPPRDGRPPDPVEIPQPPPPVKPIDPIEAAIKKLGGSVKRDQGQPDQPVVEVHLVFPVIADNDLNTLAGLARLRKLRVGGVTGVGFKDLAGLPALEHLEIATATVSDEGVKVIAGMRQLKTLILFGGKLTDTGMKELARLDQLQELTASGMLLNGPGQNEPTDNAIKELGRLKQLRKLDLSNTQVGNLSMAEFAKLPQLQELTVGSQVTDDGVKAVAGHNQLQVLRFFNNTKVTEAVIPALSMMPALRELQLTAASLKTKSQFRKGLPGKIVK